MPINTEKRKQIREVISQEKQKLNRIKYKELIELEKIDITKKLVEFNTITPNIISVNDWATKKRFLIPKAIIKDILAKETAKKYIMSDEEKALTIERLKLENIGKETPKPDVVLTDWLPKRKLYSK